MYHSIYSSSEIANPSPYAVTKSAFAAQMRFLYENRFQAITLRELFTKCLSNEEQNNGDYTKLVLLTFDDGYSDNYHNAFEILQKLSLKATFFTIVNKVGRRSFMSWEELKEIQSYGMEIGSHTLNHEPLETLSVKYMEDELRLSKRILEDKLGELITFISYPHGSYNKRVLEFAKSLGFWGSCVSSTGYYRLEDNPFEIKRFAIKRDYDNSHFEKIMQHRSAFVANLRLVDAVKRQLSHTIGINNYNRLCKFIHRLT